MEGNSPNKTLFIRGLAWAVESNDLDAFFKEQGAASAKVLWDRERNRSKGCGFIECDSVEKASELAWFSGLTFRNDSGIIEAVRNKRNIQFLKNMEQEKDQDGKLFNLEIQR